MELHSLALKTWPKYNPGVFYEPESSTKCYKPNTKYLNKLAYFHHRIAGEISPHYLRSRGEIWLRLSFHVSLGVFLRFNLHYAVWNSSPLQFCKVLFESGQQTISSDQNRSLWESCRLKLAMIIITLLPSPTADPFLNVCTLICIFLRI